MEFVRSSQPTRKTRAMSRLEREVSERIGGSVNFFTAVGTPLDRFHGIDGFFEFCGVVATIDLTLNPHKDSGKADMVVHRDDLGDLTALAGRISRELKSKLSRRV